MPIRKTTKSPSIVPVYRPAKFAIVRRHTARERRAKRCGWGPVNRRWPSFRSPAARVRQNHGVRVERTRENVFTVTATGQELSALVAGARLALDAMRSSPEAPAGAVELLGRVLDDFDRARARLSESPPNGDRP